MKGFFLMAAACMLMTAPAAKAEDWKKAFCNKKEYIPEGNKYPHLHCGKDFFTYSKSAKDHANMVNGDQANCGIVRTTIDNIKALPGATAGKKEMEDTVRSMAKRYCKKNG